ncbi:hypothetical protein [Anaerocolumna sp.]|uniref:hypothetical protein n=1 Tax=Anaerocolumna sp. TaxID=2041569 RepID=UPI0028A7D448|nr:hypothetical protein [Anaerocolumna sp.]
MKIIKNILKNELRLVCLIVFNEILRLLMKAGEYLSIGLKQAIIWFIIVAILSVIQQIIKDIYYKNHDNRKNIN